MIEVSNPFSNEISNISSASTGYADIDNLTTAGRNLLNQSINSQNNVLNTGNEQIQTEMNNNLSASREMTNRTNKGLYDGFKRQINNDMTGNDSLLNQGLGGKISESVKTSLYNSYQKNVTEQLENLTNIEKTYKLKMKQIEASKNVAEAELLANRYSAEIDLVNHAYQLAQAQKEFEWKKLVDSRDYNYQLGRDKVTDNRWQKEFDYKKKRDKVSDKQWEKQYELSRKKASSSSRGRSGRKSRGKSYLNSINPKDTSVSNVLNKRDYTKDIVKAMSIGGKILVGAGRRVDGKINKRYYPSTKVVKGIIDKIKKLKKG